MSIGSRSQFVIVPPGERNPDPTIPEQPQLHDDTRFAAGKIAIFQYSTVVIFLFLISGFWSSRCSTRRYMRSAPPEPL